MINKSIIYSLFALGFAIAQSGCSTLEGMGRDMQNIGQGISSSNSGNKSEKSESATPPSGAVVTPIK